MATYKTPYYDDPGTFYDSNRYLWDTPANPRLGNKWGLTVTVGAADLDLRLIPVPVTVTHGRADIDTQPDAPTLAFTYLGAIPPGNVGDAVRMRQELAYIQAVYDAATNYYDSDLHLWDHPGTLDPSTRFVGTITGMSAREANGTVAEWDVRAVGGLARLGTISVSGHVRPEESDVARVQGIADAAGVPLTILGGVGPTLVGVTLDADALSALQDVCYSSAGLIWQDREGAVFYGTHDHRNADPAVALPPDIVLDGVEWTQETGDIINRAIVKYGAGAVATAEDSNSIAMPWGLKAADIATLLASADDADMFANVIIARHAWPYWLTPGMMLPLDIFSPSDMAAVQEFDVSTPVFVPIPSDPATTPAPQAKWVVEGWSEEWREDGHWMQVALTEFGRYGSQGVRTWADAMLNTWAQEAAGTWIDALTTLDDAT